MAKIELTPAQRMAVQLQGDALLVSAAAGSGKTKVLVDRLMRLICQPEHPCNIDDFLMITYTRAAAAEMRAKIADALQKQLAQQPENRHLQRQMSRIYLAQISTVHGFCTDLLRRYAYTTDLPVDFRVAEPSECGALRQAAMEKTLEQAYTRLDSEPEIRAFLDTLCAGRSDKRAAQLIFQAYDSANCQPDPEAWMHECCTVSEQAQQPEQTAWGRLLLSNLHDTAARQAAMLTEAVQRMQQDEAVNKGYGAAFASDLEQAERLARQTQTWDQAYQHAALQFARLGRVGKNADTELQQWLKAVRDEEKDELTRAVEAFYAPASQVMAEQRQCDAAVSGLFALVRRFARFYRQEKRRRKLLDFSDLEHEALRLLYTGAGQPTAAAQQEQARYVQILVDEYQDSNRLQDRIFFAVSRQGRNLFFVGDVKQSIYRFRLADPTIFLEKFQTYRQADPQPDPPEATAPSKVLLAQNFRSRPEILEAVNEVFAQCMSPAVGDVCYDESEALRPGRSGSMPDMTAVELHAIDLTYDDEEHPEKRDAEAVYVARRIHQLLQEQTCISDGGTLRPVRPGDIVILLSTIRSVAPNYVRALQRYGIGVSCEQEDNLLEHIEISALLALLRVIDNPRQDISLYAALASPLFGFTADELAQARACCRQGDFYDCCVAAAAGSGKMAAFLQQLQQLRRLAVQLPVDRLIAEIYRMLEVEAVFGAMEQGSGRRSNLQAFFLLAVQTAQSGSGRLHRFLAQIDSRAEQGIPAQKAAGTSDGQVKIMSIHKSKGLEFPVVILAGLSRKFNTQDLTRPVLLHPQLGAAVNLVDLERGVQYPSAAKKAMVMQLRRQMRSEQLRVLYVAMTRAKDLLIMTYAQSKLPKMMQQMVQQLDTLDSETLSGRAPGLGHWVMMHALQRVEAGQLFAQSGRPQQVQVYDTPWRITYADSQQVLEAMQPEQSQQPEAVQSAAPPAADQSRLQQWLDFRYPGVQAGQVPTKITATQLKGRFLDQELDQTRAPLSLPLRQADFRVGARPLRPAQVGVATHLAMQFVSYEACSQPGGAQREIARLERENYLTPQQAEAVDAAKIERLFFSPLGQRILQADRCIREFKFSILVDAAPYFPQAAGEQIMLQGVTDCCLIENGGITVIDFKTDRITPEREEQTAAYYRGQLEAYAGALERIFQMPVRQKLLYFFATEHVVEV